MHSAIATGAANRVPQVRGRDNVSVPHRQMGFLELCLKSGTVMEWHITWEGVDMKVVNGKFSYADDLKTYPVSMYLAVNGRIGPNKATGTAKFLAANIMPNLRAEICTSGSPRWTATPSGSAHRARERE